MRTTKLRAGLAIWLIVGLTSGCASTAPPARTVEAPPLGSHLPRYEATESPPAFEEPHGELSLQDALALALLHNPELAVFSWEIRAREAEALQAGLLPNPEFAGEVENFGGTGTASGFQGSETTLALSQLIELGGKRSKRLDLARLERDLSAWDYESERIDVLTETTKAFIAVLAAREQLSLADELTEMANRVLQSVARRVRAGATSPVEENRARVALETTRIDRERAARDLSIARSALAAQWGRTATKIEVATEPLGQLLPLPALSDLTDGIGRTPTLARWTTEIIRREAEKELAESGRVPDLSVGAGLRHFGETGDVAAVLGVSLPLPFFDRNQGAVAAAESRIAQAEHARRSVTTAVQVALQAAHAEAAASFDEASALRDRAIPEAASAFSLAEEFYSRGRMSLTDVLDTERTLFELRTRLVDALLRYHTAVAELERLAGTPLSDFASDPRRQEP